jgi:DNA-binding MarR family transcriptional regulator
MRRRQNQLTDLWTYQTVRLADKVSRLSLAAARAEAGLNLSQWRVLAAVADQAGRSATEVVAMTPMDKGVVSRSVETLVKAKLLKKQLHPRDGRRVILTLTARGAKIQQKIAQRIQHEVSKVEAPDFNSLHFVDLLRRANKAIRDDGSGE